MKKLLNCCFPKEKEPEPSTDFSSLFKIKPENTLKKIPHQTETSSNQEILNLRDSPNRQESLGGPRNKSTAQRKPNQAEAESSRENEQIEKLYLLKEALQSESNDLPKIPASQLKPRVTTSLETLEKIDANKITDIEVQENPKLELVEVEGKALSGQRLEINASGMSKNSLRNAKDGQTLFGIRNQSLHSIGNANDFVLSINGNSSTITLFRIFFDRNLKKYFIHSQVGEVDKTVVFLRLDSRHRIDSKSIISLGEVHLAVDVDDQQSLKIDIIYQNEETKTKVYSKAYKKIIRAGRNSDNEIVLQSDCLSRVHSSFVYDDSANGWFVQDGIGEKPSTNGTWIYLNGNWEIERSLYFRIGTNFMAIRKI